MQSPSRSDPNYDKLWKIRPLITALEKNCRELYSPHPQLSVDESMIGTKCRLSFIQYMPAKPVKWGVKVWVLCDSVNGYICTFDVYTGKDTSGSTVHAHGLAYSIVMKLVKSYLKKGHIVYTDNYYSSPQLFEDLWKEGTYASGTVRTNRKHFPDFLKPQLVRGSHVFAYYKSTTVVRWSDNKDVYALSTFLSDATTQVKRQSGSASISISCPEIIHDYNLFMGGVDLADQAMCYYSVGRKSMKWWCLLAYARSCNNQCSCDLQSKHSHISFKTHPQSKIQASPHTTN